jgi:predicted metalloprotease
MEWEGREESENVEDRRGLSGKAMIGGGAGIIVVILALLFGVDPRQFVGPGGGGGAPRKADPEEERMAKFSRVVFRDTEVVWDKLFREQGKTYRKPKLVFYTDQVDSGCGSAPSSVGPFYCPRDSKVYIDLSFYKEMEHKLDAGGEFARAYVIAHEVGHHVQRLLGYSQRVDEARGRVSKTEENRLSVRLELQADFLAGVWAHHGQKEFKFLQKGDLESAINAAFQIGDDRLQQRAGRVVVPHSFTHGTSEQRMRWFKQGFKTGDVGGAAELFELPYDRL